ncbi:MAG: response regulator [Hymenobacter sp.]
MSLCGCSEKLGYAAEAVNDGQKAVERVMASQYSLVLMDCQMPVMDGLRATPRDPEAGSREAHADRCADGGAHSRPMNPNCLTAGMDGFVAKPIDLNKLAQILKQWHEPATEHTEMRQ